MVDRVKITSEGVYVSRPGYDVNTAAIENLSMYPNMGVMAQVLTDTVTLASGQSQDFPINNPQQIIPYVILNTTDGQHPERSTFCAETSPPYTTVRIRNISGPTRNIRFTVFVSNQ